MKARKKGTNNPFVDIDKIQLQGSDILFSSEIMEFEIEHNFDYLSTELKTNAQIEKDEYWDKLKHQAAIAAMQGTINILSNSDRFAFYEIVSDNYTGEKKTYPNEIAEFATACAESLIEKLKGD